MPNKKTLVLAGNYAQYINFCKEKGLHSKNDQYYHASWPGQIQGHTFCDIEIIGTFWDRKDARDLLELAQSRVR